MNQQEEKILFLWDEFDGDISTERLLAMVSDATGVDVSTIVETLAKYRGEKPC